MRSEGVGVREDVQARTLSRDPCEVPVARRFVRAVLAGHPAAADAELLACELVTNAVVHARGAEQVTVRVEASEAGVHVEVADDGRSGVPCWPEPDAGEESGRGFHLVDAIATRWSLMRDQTGTCCWFDLDDSQPQ
jgi:anti-sigma regulatory factor (Ser/Thr protein kinase)